MWGDIREMTDRELVMAFDCACKEIQKSYGIIYGDTKTRNALYVRHSELKDALLERLGRAPKVEIPLPVGVVRTET